MGLPPWWLNEQATACISGKDTPPAAAAKLYH